MLLTNMEMLPATPDPSLTAADVNFDNASVVEGENVTINATLHNSIGTESGPLTAAFYATLPQWGEWYLGSTFLPSIPAQGSAQATLLWNTLGFTGTLPVRVVVDPYDRVVEGNETNNEATRDITILTRPDLQVSEWNLSNPEPVTAEAVEVTLTLSNTGQAEAGAQTVALYQGNPDSGGTLISEQLVSALAGEAETTLSFAWTPTSPGSTRLFARLDRNAQVAESNEANNDVWHDLYVGFEGPLLLDSGGASDVAYGAGLGYGYLNGVASILCGTDPEKSYRRATSGEVLYQFDHLLPGHYYHLDITMRECDGLGREQTIWVDSNQLGEVITLSSAPEHRISLLLDPALYTDNSIVVGVREATGNTAIISEINLYDIDYRYADSGGAVDPPYPASPPGQSARRYGWLDGEAQTIWGTLPYQSRRIDVEDNDLRYQFDGLDPSKRYGVNLTFFQNAGGLARQTVFADALNTGLTVELTGQQQIDESIELPPASYTDGSVVVRIVRTSNPVNAYVNAIALEEITLSEEAPPILRSDKILLQLKRQASGSQVLGMVYVEDGAAAVVRGATVQATWTFPNGSSQTRTATTDAAGRAKFSTRVNGSGTYTLTVTNISATGYTFDPASSVLSRSIVVR